METESGVIIVSEPYGLSDDDFGDFTVLKNAGWQVSIDERLATYFPGRAVCVLLRPPN
jgi:hypothetical protein